MKHSVSAIIRTYTHKRWDYTNKSIQSVLSQTYPLLEIIVVVDHNPDLAERLRERWRQEEKVIIIENWRSQGSSGTCNAGVDVAKGDIVAFIDDDAAAEVNWIEELVSVYDSEAVMASGGSIYPNWEADSSNWMPEEFYWVVGCSYKGLPEETAPIRNLILCNMSVRREVFDVVEFPENTGLGHVGGVPVGVDETEFCIRLGSHFPEKVFIHHPPAIVYHAVPAERIKWSYFIKRCWLEGRSKAILSGMVGTQKGLSSEWDYVLKALPLGMFRALSQGKPLKAFAIVLGLMTTTLNYIRVRIFSNNSLPTIGQSPQNETKGNVARK
jgi:glycosyltransferase involved in cell wall biosynthesis